MLIKVIRCGRAREETYCAPLRALYGTEAQKYWCVACRISQNRCVSVLRRAVVKDFEVSMGSSTSRMHYPLGNTFVVKMVDLFAGDLILQE